MVFTCTVKISVFVRVDHMEGRNIVKVLVVLLISSVVIIFVKHGHSKLVKRIGDLVLDSILVHT